MLDLLMAETAAGTQYMLPLLSSAEYIAQAKENGTWISMNDTNYDDDFATGLTDEPEEGRWRIMQAFNDRNGLNLDAQESYPNREGVTVLSEAGDVPRTVATFEDIVDFQDWANSLDRMGEPEALEAVLEAMLATSDLAAARGYAEYTKHLATRPVGRPSVADAIGYEPGDYKAERSAA